MKGIEEMKVIVTLNDIITIAVCIIYVIGVVVYILILTILENIRRHKNKKSKGVNKIWK